MLDFSKELNSEQLKVVQNADGPCLVLAGAGSGKTRVITYRVAYLLEKGIKPENILLVTFTNKAANEMINRIKSLTENAVTIPWSGTYHHIAYRILRRYAPVLGYKNNFTVLDNEDSKDLLKLCLKQENVDKKDRRFPSTAVIQSIISYSKNAEKTIEEVLDEKYPKWLEISETICRVADEYQKRKKNANAMDFDDLLVNWLLLLLKSEKVRQYHTSKFEYILVDEYQDTNKIQAEIIKILAEKHKNILVVGDDAQSIYSFRAADIKNILDFEKNYSNAKIFRLETNYRSTPEILNLANVVIANNVNQYEKNLKSILKPFAKPEIDSFADQFAEADFVVQRISELIGEGVNLSEIAVLFRAAFHSQALEMALVKRNILYDYRGGLRFFERAHIKDVLAFLRIYSNKEDVVAWNRILNMQTGIGPASAEEIINLIKKTDKKEEIKNISEKISSRAQIGFNNFLQIWNKLIDTDGTPKEIIETILDSKYVEYLEAEYPDQKDRIEDIKQLCVFASKENDLSKFLAEATLQESYNAKNVSNENDKKERIILSTIHQAKGLEWQAVFIINLANGQFPNDRALKENGGLEEERRLFYVAVTRAKKHLHLTYPLSASFGGYLQSSSMFLGEIDRDLVSDNSTESSGDFSVFNDGEVTYVSEEDDANKPKRSFLMDVGEF